MESRRLYGVSRCGKKKLNKRIDINYYLKGLIGLCARFINYEEKFQPSPDDDSLRNIIDPDKLWTKKDELVPKSAEKWDKKYIKGLRDAPKKEETIISHLWKEAISHAEKIYSGIGRKNKETRNCITKNVYLNVLDKIADSIRFKTIRSTFRIV